MAVSVTVCQVRDACKMLSSCDVGELRAAAAKASADSEKLRAELAKSRALNVVLRESRQKATRAMVPVIRERNEARSARTDAEKQVRSLMARATDLDGVARRAVLEKSAAQKSLAEHKHSARVMQEQAQAQAQAHAQAKAEANAKAHAQAHVHAQIQAAHILRRAVLRRRQRSQHACACACRIAFRAAHAALVAASDAAGSAAQSRAQHQSRQQQAVLRAELASATAELTAAAVRSKKEAARVATFSREAEAEAQRREHVAAAAVRLELQERCTALQAERDELRKELKCGQRKHSENVLDQRAQVAAELQYEHRVALDQKQQECDEALEALVEAKREQNLAAVAKLEKKHNAELQKLSEKSQIQLHKANAIAAQQERELREQLVRCRKEHDTAFNMVAAREAATVRELYDARLAWDSKLTTACTEAAEGAALDERTTLQAAHEVALVQARRKEREVVLSTLREEHETQVAALREEHIAELHKMTNSKSTAFAAEVQQLQASHEREVAVLNSRIAELERTQREQATVSKAALADHAKQLAEERQARRKVETDIEQYRAQSAETASTIASHEKLAAEREAATAVLNEKCAHLERSLRAQRAENAANAKEHTVALTAAEHARREIMAQLQKTEEDRERDTAAAKSVAATAAQRKLQAEHLRKANAELEARCTAAQKAAEERGDVMLQQKDSEMRDLKSANKQCRDDLLQMRNELQNLKRINADLLRKEADHDSAIVRLQRDYTEQLAALQQQLELEERVRREIHEKMMELRGTIRVFCRVRPLLPRESSFAGSECVRAEQHTESGEKQAVALHSVDGSGRDCSKTFSFDRVFMQSEGRHHVHDEVKELMRSVCDGKHVCIFAYGQTGSGKTYTMDELSEFAVLELQRMQVQKSKRSASAAVAMEASMLEVYNENVVSLLPPSADGHGDAVSAIAAQAWQRVESAVPLQAAVAAAKSRRASRSHKLNKCSSRSHCLLWLRLADADGGAQGGSLLLADLAGSERVAKSGVLQNKTALLEATCINKSLSALGDVVSAMVTKQRHVPYRNSLLTQLLQPVLACPDTKVLMICTVSPAPDSSSESMASLQFASRCGQAKVGATQRTRRRRRQSAGAGSSGSGSTERSGDENEDDRQPARKLVAALRSPLAAKQSSSQSQSSTTRCSWSDSKLRRPARGFDGEVKKRLSFAAELQR